MLLAKAGESTSLSAVNMLVGNRLRQHIAMKFIAMIGWLAVFDAKGIVLGPIVATLTFTLWEIWRRRT